MLKYLSAKQLQKIQYGSELNNHFFTPESYLYPMKVDMSLNKVIRPTTEYIKFLIGFNSEVFCKNIFICIHTYIKLC